MQIPFNPNGGSAVAQPAQATSVPTPDVSSGVNELTGTVGAIGNDYVDKQNRLKASLALATSENALRDAHAAVSRGVLDGSIPADQAKQQFAEQAQAIQTTNSQGLTRDHADMLNAQLTGLQGAYESSLNGTIIKRGQSETAATLDQFGEQVSRKAIANGDPKWASEKYDAMLDFAGQSAGLTPEQVTTKKQAFASHTTAGYFDSKATNLLAAGSEALQSGDSNGFASNLSGLTDTLHEVMGAAGDAMDPNTRAETTHRVLGYQNQLLAGKKRDDAADAAAKLARENAGVDAFNQAREVVQNGAYLSKDAIDDLTAKTAGTSVEPAVRNMLASQATIAGFASAPASQRAATIERFRSEGADPTIGTSPDNQRHIALMVNINAKANAAAKENPWAAAQQYGVITHAPVMDPTDPVAAQQIVQQRMQQIGRVEQWVGHKISPMQPEEAAVLAKSLRSLPPEQQASALSNLGASIGDDERIAAFAKQLGDKDGTMGLQMAFAGNRTASGRLVAELIGRGAQALKDKTTTDDMSKVTGWRATIAAAIGDAYPNPEIRNAAIEAAIKVTAAREAMGQASGDTDTAINLVTGGIIQHGAAGAKLPLPYGMTEDAFNSKLKTITVDSLAPQAQGAARVVDGKTVPLVFAGREEIPLDDLVKRLPNLTLVHAGQGRYVVSTGSSYVMNLHGDPITLKVAP